MHFGETTELGIIKNKTGYEARDPSSDHSKVSYLEVIKPLKWSCTHNDVSDLIPIGSLTWCYNWNGKDESILLEDNRYGVNFHPDCFRFIKHESYGEQEIDDLRTITEKMYRFKTKFEFIDIGKWNSRPENNGYPERWASGLEMNHYIGKLLTKDQQEVVKDMLKTGKSQVTFGGWTFFNHDFTELKAGYFPVDYGHIEFKKAVINSPKPIQQVDWRDPPKFSPLSSTSEQAAPIIYESKKEELNDDIVIESTINITI
jgi:hypothetical protein